VWRRRHALVVGLIVACRKAPAPVGVLGVDGGSSPVVAAEGDGVGPPGSPPAARPIGDAASPTTSTATGPERTDSGATPGERTAGRAPGDGGTRPCAVLRGPIELPVRAPVALTVRPDHVEAVLNDDGRPRIVTRPAGPVPLGPVPTGREPAEGDRGTASGIPCATAGERIFCLDRSGAVHRTPRAGGEDRVIASARSTSRIAAATLAGSHTALGYLASRQTSEGWVSEAWLAVDDDAPQRVSEDGSGATALALSPHGSGLLVLTVDARAALTAMHARPVAYDGRLRLGEDAVAFVGGPGDRRTRAALVVPAAGPAWSLLPIAKDVGSFGLAIVRIDEPPRVDEPVLWSMYPNGLDPAPVASVSTGVADPVAWVALVRPSGPEPSSARVLELAELGPDGALTARDVVPTTGNASDVVLATDAFGALWLGWVDGGGSWLERLACASKNPRK